MTPAPTGVTVILNNATMPTGDITVLNMTNVSCFSIQLTNQCTTTMENCTVHVYTSVDGTNWDSVGVLLQAKPGNTAVKSFIGGCQVKLSNLTASYDSVTILYSGH